MAKVLGMNIESGSNNDTLILNSCQRSDDVEGSALIKHTGLSSSFTQKLLAFLFGQHRNHEKLSVILRYLIITYSMTLFTFLLLVVFRYTKNNSVEVNANEVSGEPDTMATVTQLIWALSPLTATLFICYGPFKSVHAPISTVNPEDEDDAETNTSNNNVAYTVWNWKMRVFYHVQLNRSYNTNHSPASQTILPLSSSNDDIHALNSSPSLSPASPSSSSSSSSSTLSSSPSSSRPLLLHPRFPLFFSYFHHFNYSQHYSLLLASWFIVSLLFTSVSSFAQYLFSILFFACNLYSSSFILKLQSVLALSSLSAYAVIILAFLYTFLFGFMWDIFPPLSVDWGAGMGFSGCSWFALSYIEEIGWSVLLFPALLNYMKGDLFRASMWTGLIWSSWHYFAVLFSAADIIPAGTGYTVGLLTTPLLYGFTMFTISTIALRIIICHISLCSGSLYTSIALHALHNVFSISFFAQLPAIQSSLASFMIAECGFILMAIYVSCAAYCVYTWKQMYVINNKSSQGDVEYTDLSACEASFISLA